MAQENRPYITCEQACRFAYHRDRGWEIIDYATCELTLDDAPGATPDAVVGGVVCTGHGTESYCEGGRRPIGHVELVAGGSGLAAHLARSAHLEAASVVAFEQLAARLDGWGAPPTLVDRCRRAAAEEVEHAERLGALARRGGAAVPPARHRACDVDLLTAALDNAVEGCVLEAWSALRAAWIARRARAPELREAYAQIAADEAGHAQLAWDLHAWFVGQLPPAEREQVAAAQRAAIARLPALARAQTAGMPALLGLPGPRESASLSARFAAGLAEAA
jgi:hypothetical protein